MAERGHVSPWAPCHSPVSPVGTIRLGRLGLVPSSRRGMGECPKDMRVSQWQSW